MYGETVKRLRLLSGLTQKQLASEADVALNTVKNLESGKLKNPTLNTLIKIADALGVSVILGEVLRND